jgi:hypothetical protein
MTLGALESRGFVERRADPGDGRRIIVSLTASGGGILRHMRDARVRQFAKILTEEFTAAELKALVAAAPLIERLGDNIYASTDRIRSIDTARPFPSRFLAPLLIGLALNLFNSSVIATAMVPVATALHSSVGRTAVLISVLYVATAIGQPTVGKLASSSGRGGSL